MDIFIHKLYYFTHFHSVYVSIRFYELHVNITRENKIGLANDNMNQLRSLYYARKYTRTLTNYTMNQNRS